MTDAQARTVVATVAILITAALAALLIGRDAVVVVLLLAVLWLVWDRATVHERIDEARDDADLARGKIEAVENHLSGLEPPGRGRHAHQGRSRTRSAGTDFTCLPRPQSYVATNVTDARHWPSGQRTHASCVAGSHTPSCNTSTARGSIRRTGPSGDR